MNVNGLMINGTEDTCHTLTIHTGNRVRPTTVYSCTGTQEFKGISLNIDLHYQA